MLIIILHMRLTGAVVVGDYSDYDDDDDDDNDDDDDDEEEDGDDVRFFQRFV